MFAYNEINFIFSIVRQTSHVDISRQLELHRSIISKTIKVFVYRGSVCS